MHKSRKPISLHPWGAMRRKKPICSKLKRQRLERVLPKPPILMIMGFITGFSTPDQIEEFSEFEDANDTVLEFVDADVRDESELLLDEASNSCEIKGAKQDEVVSSKTRQDAEQLAIELLAARAFTTIELQKKLRGRKYPLDIVDSVIAEIKSRGLLSDGLYAESFSQSRWLSSTWGPRRIKQALRKKGISEVEADKATRQVFEDDDGSGESPSMQHGMSKTSMDRLFLQASKQWLRGRSTSLQNRKARLVRWLQYRGFSWGVTSTILKRLESQYPLRE
ncbi:regulatory protein RecX isoform X2 [Phoenix dactylifera]|uniref:Regulatory protein RecX n=1 Tax=Phoenix dactylifera TaxID=42345 RepID=A0A8B8IZP6_PHODC|nr:regulatory protein RecX isoform X2 [Phoenix dactylifera]